MRAARAMEQAGCRVKEADMPDVTDATGIFFSMAGADGGVRTLKDLEGQITVTTSSSRRCWMVSANP